MEGEWDRNEHELYVLLRKVRYDLTAAQAKISEAFRMLDSLKLPLATSGITCPHAHCKLPMAGERALAFHLANIHDGEPVPLTAEEEVA